MMYELPTLKAKFQYAVEKLTRKDTLYSRVSESLDHENCVFGRNALDQLSYKTEWLKATPVEHTDLYTLALHQVFKSCMVYRGKSFPVCKEAHEIPVANPANDSAHFTRDEAGKFIAAQQSAWLQKNLK